MQAQHQQTIEALANVDQRGTQRLTLKSHDTLQLQHHNSASIHNDHQAYQMRKNFRMQSPSVGSTLVISV
jgi:hypothetical protein